jgi:hypothetical protein
LLESNRTTLLNNSAAVIVVSTGSRDLILSNNSFTGSLLVSDSQNDTANGNAGATFDVEHVSNGMALRNTVATSGGLKWRYADHEVLVDNSVSGGSLLVDSSTTSTGGAVSWNDLERNHVSNGDLKLAHGTNHLLLTDNTAQHIYATDESWDRAVRNNIGYLELVGSNHNNFTDNTGGGGIIASSDTNWNSVSGNATADRIQLESANNAKIQNNSLYSMHLGGSRNTVQRNNVGGHIEVASASDVTIVGNNVSGLIDVFGNHDDITANVAAQIVDSSGIGHNLIYDNDVSGDIYLQSDSSVAVYSNVMGGSRIAVSDLDHWQVHHNSVAAGDILLFNPSTAGISSVVTGLTTGINNG